MIVRLTLCILMTAWLTMSSVWAADDDLPKRRAFDRYQPMLDHSPFAVATAAAAPAVIPDAFKGLYVANVARTPEGDLVTVMSSDDKNFKEYLSTKQPNERGWGIASVEWSDQPGATKVTISKDGKFGTLTFNQALLQAPGSNSTLLAQPQMQPGMQPGMQPMPQPAPPTPASMNPKPGRLSPGQSPHTRPVIQRNPPPVQPQQVLPED